MIEPKLNLSIDEGAVIDQVYSEFENKHTSTPKECTPAMVDALLAQANQSLDFALYVLSEKEDVLNRGFIESSTFLDDSLESSIKFTNITIDDLEESKSDVSGLKVLFATPKLEPLQIPSSDQTTPKIQVVKLPNLQITPIIEPVNCENELKMKKRDGNRSSSPGLSKNFDKLSLKSPGLSNSVKN